jgi:hypothetical protein
MDNLTPEELDKLAEIFTEVQEDYIKELRKPTKRKWLWEFSKKIVVTVTILFVAVFLFSCILLIFYPDSSAIQFVIENISDIFKVTVVSYAVKAGFENVTKIRKGGNEDGSAY